MNKMKKIANRLLIMKHNILFIVLFAIATQLYAREGLVHNIGKLG
jgi:hypothetical protein